MEECAAAPACRDDGVRLLRYGDRLSRQVLTCHGVFEAYALPARTTSFANSTWLTGIGPRNVLRASCTIPGPFRRARAARRPTAVALDPRLVPRAAAWRGHQLLRTLDRHAQRSSKPGLSTPEIAPFRRRRWPNRGLGLAARRGGQVHTLKGPPATATHLWPRGRAGRWRARGCLVLLMR